MISGCAVLAQAQTIRREREDVGEQHQHRVADRID
jgi:hypothetical protein